MKPQWYCGVDGQQFGPFTWEQMRAMAAEGRLHGESYVRRDADQQWFLAAQIPGLIAKAKPATAVPVGAAVGAAVSAPASAAPPATADSSVSRSVVATAAQATGASSTKLKKAKPLAAVPAGVAVAAVPSGMPVGQPVPTGVAVGVPPTSPPAMSFAVGPRAAANDDDDDGPSPGKKSGNAWLVVGVLGGICGVVAIAGVVLIAMSMANPPKAEQNDEVASAENEVAAALAAEKAAAQSEEIPIAEANPAAAAPAAGGKTGSQTQAEAPESAALAVITSQTKWSNLLTHRAIKLGTMTLQVSGVWLASDAQGTRVNPVLPAGTSAPTSESPAAAETAAPAEGEAPAAEPSDAPVAAPDESIAALPAKFVFVEVKITNGGPVPKKYASWNGAEPTDAVLADHANQFLSLVPTSATPGVQRHGTMQISPGQTVTDLLVFTAPAMPVESLKLALAKTAISDITKGHWAFEIPLESLFPKPQPGTAPGVSGGPVIANQAPTPGGGDAPPPIIETVPAVPQAVPVTPAPAEPPKKPNRPPTIEELNKQFEELDKQKKDAEKAAADKAAVEKGAK